MTQTHSPQLHHHLQSPVYTGGQSGKEKLVAVTKNKPSTEEKYNKLLIVCAHHIYLKITCMTTKKTVQYRPSNALTKQSMSWASIYILLVQFSNTKYIYCTIIHLYITNTYEYCLQLHVLLKYY